MPIALSSAAFVELVRVAAATSRTEEIGAASLFGHTGTAAITVAAGVIVMGGAIVAWQRVGGVPRPAAATPAYASGGLVPVLIFSLFTSDSDAIGVAIALSPAELADTGRLAANVVLFTSLGLWPTFRAASQPASRPFGNKALLDHHGKWAGAQLRHPMSLSFGAMGISLVSMVVSWGAVPQRRPAHVSSASTSFTHVPRAEAVMSCGSS